MDNLLKQWNENYFDGQLSPEVLNILDGLALSTQSKTVQGIVERQFKAMELTHFQATDFTDDQARKMCALPDIVPEVWVGTLPSLTFPGRHVKIDAYIRCNRWRQFQPMDKLLDLGCDFPPLTTIEIAEKLPDWQIVGADSAIPYDIVYEKQGNHATFHQARDLLYFQGQAGRGQAFMRDPAGTKASFNQLIHTLLPEHGVTEPEMMKPAGSNGTRRATNPSGVYERASLSFQSGAMGEVDLQGLDVVRCFNVLFYFDRPFRNEAMTWFTEILRDGGLLLCGVNDSVSQVSRYTVYQRERGRLLAKEFAFSVDNLRPPGVASCWTFHYDEIEMNMQAVVVELIRADTAFRRDFDARLDALLAEYRLFKRGADGYLTSWGVGRPTDKEDRLAQISDQLDQEGYVEGAVDILKRTGYHAWRNCVGHISVAPGQFDI